MTTRVRDPGQRVEAHVLAVVLDRAHARFFDVQLSRALELPSLHSPAMRGGKFHSDRQGGPGWGEHDYHGRIREEQRRHIDAVVQRLLRLDRERPVDGLVLAGPGPAAAAIVRALPPALTRRLIGTAHLNPTEVTPAAVWQAAREARVVEAADRTSLLVDWLNELLFHAEAEWWVPVEFAAVRATDTAISARVRGLPSAEPPAALKAATLPGVSVRDVPGGLEAKVVLQT